LPSRLPDFLAAVSVLFLLLYAPPANGQEGFTEVVYAVTLNGEQMSDGAILLKDAEGSLFISEEDLKLWRLREPSGMRALHHGKGYFALGAIQGAETTFDSATQTLRINVPPERFEKTTLNRGSIERTAPARGAGGFFNYDFSLTGGGGVRQRLDSLYEVGVFNSLGAGASSFLGNDAGRSIEFARLESVWTMDYVSKRQTIRLGDSFTRGGSTGRPVRFGGLQWARNFSTDPGFITFPTPAIGGLAQRESVVDVYVNNIKQMSDKVPGGPFELFNVPVVSGKGDVGLVVRDLLGREYIVTEPYYISPALLRKGLSDFSFEAGFERENYGLRSNDYADYLAAGTYRSGLSDRFTSEAHIEVQEGLGMMSLSGVWLNQDLGVFSFGIAQSRDKKEDWGSQGLLGYELAMSRFNIGLGSKLATRTFSQLGGEVRQPFEYENRGRLGFGLGRLGSVGLTLTQRREFGRESSNIVTGSYHVNVWKGHLNLTAIRTHDSVDTYGLTATYVLPLESRRTIVANSGVQRESSSAGLELQKSLSSSELGYSYRVRADRNGDAEGLQASLTRQGGWNRVQMDFSTLNNEHFYRLGTSGSVGFLDGKLFASRWLYQSFGFVDVADYENVRVYSNNQELGRTNNNGRIFVPDLAPYQMNRLRIEESDLPLDCRIDATEITAVPYYRSGMSMEFPIRPVRGALTTVVTPDDSPLPAGSVIRSPGREGEWFVGLKGEVYLTDLNRGENVFEAHVGDRKCRLVVVAPYDLAGTPNLGKNICRFDE